MKEKGLNQRGFNLLLWTFINGRHSNIPLCCTLYYTKQQLHPDGHTALRTSIRRGECTDFESFQSKEVRSVGYVQCDNCYATGYSQEIKQNGTIKDYLLDD